MRLLSTLVVSTIALAAAGTANASSLESLGDGLAVAHSHLALAGGGFATTDSVVSRRSHRHDHGRDGDREGGSDDDGGSGSDGDSDD